MSTGISGAYCAQQLALIGADVIRVALTSAPHLNVAPGDEIIDELLELGKSRLVLDLAREEDRAHFIRLVADADALIDDAGPAGFTAFGLDEDVLFEHRPSLVRTRISEFGLDGPWASWHGSELVNLAAGGLLFLTGTFDRPPVQLAPFQAQLTGGLLAAIATSAALYAGGPATVDISKQEAVMAMLTPSLTNYAYTGVIDAREGTVAGMTRIEQASDTWVYAGPSSPTSADYETYAAFLGIPELAEPRFSTPERRMEHWDEHQALIAPRLRERTAKEWVDDAATWRLTFGYVQTTTDVLECPVLSERAFFADVPTSKGRVRTPLAPYLTDGVRPTVLSHPAASLEPAQAPAGDD